MTINPFKGRSHAEQDAKLKREILQVVRRDNCTGCGACVSLSSSIHMELNPQGFARPVWGGSTLPLESPTTARFRAICPGVGIKSARNRSVLVHRTMGPYIAAFEASACEPEIRFAGSSAGVLTALSAWMLESGRVDSVTSAAMSKHAPSRTVALQLRTRAQVLESAGSRYAPVSNAQLFDPHPTAGLFIGKPCEAYAARQILVETGIPADSHPILLSFFCAGVPSQWATDKLIRQGGMDPSNVESLRYRGNGWPGSFTVRDTNGKTASFSYEESWGASLGPTVQSRCKICPDGVGEHADVSVGDYWQSDKSGYPQFEEAAGLSVAIARTPRGHQLLLDAARAGVLNIRPLDLDSVASVQPLQVKRLTTLAGRLTGRILAGHRVPRFTGFSLIRSAISRPRATVLAARGTFRRSSKSHR